MKNIVLLFIFLMSVTAQAARKSAYTSAKRPKAYTRYHACADATSGRQDLRLCMQVTKDMSIQKIAACYSTTKTGDGFFECLVFARNPWVDEDKILACDEATKVLTTWRICMRWAPHTDVKDILYCGKETVMPQSFNLCLSTEEQSL